MEIKDYPQDIQDLITQFLNEVRSISPNALKTSAKLLKIATSLSDDSLKSSIYYHKALYYYFQSDISTYRPLIKKAIFHALKADDQLLLSRIYNIIAVDAHNSGCFDIAYNYYILAYNYANANDDIGSIALLESNLGRLFTELKEYKLARKYFRSSIRKFKKDKYAINHDLTEPILKASDGIISLLLNDIDAAEKSLKTVDKIVEKLDEETANKIHLPRTLLATRLALKKKDKAESRKMLKELISLLENEALVQELIDDINGLYNELMEQNMEKEAKDLIERVDNAFMSTGINYVTAQFCEIKADYYERVKDDKKLFEALKAQYKLNIKLRSEQQEMYSHAVSLIGLLDTLRAEQTKVLSENEQLKQIAEIDALTGIANRFKMNQVLNSPYYENKSLAIGILDLDYFKEYNDNYGHRTGDKCLRKVASELSKIAKENSLFVARYGGDEFMIIYEKLNEKEIKKIAGEIHSRIAKLNIKHEYSLLAKHVTISQGICYGTPKNRSVLWDFLSMADESLYSIKKNRQDNPKQIPYHLVRFE